MNLTIHRGTKEIGGSCVELKSANTRILIDFGMPLVGADKKPFDSNILKGKTVAELKSLKILPDISGLYENEEKTVDAILISHSHLDHYGFLHRINKNIPIYMSRGCKDLISIAYYFGQTQYDPRNAKAVPSWETFKIGDMEITPYLVDHSAFDAFAYLVETDKKRLFYSGDFRRHGRKGVLFENQIKKPPKNIDVLVVEGTMLSRDGDNSQNTEEAICGQLVKEFKQADDLILISVSSQNIDRLVSIYIACSKAGKIFVVSPYTAYILEQLKRKGITLPQFDWTGIKVYFAQSSHTRKLAEDKSLFKYKSAKITCEEIEAQRGNVVVLDSYYVRNKFAKKGLLKGATLIYSQWEGYLEGAEGFWEENDVSIKKIHTSGHVFLEDLKVFIKALNPGKIIPIHTFAAEKFREYWGDKVMMIDDGEEIEIF